MSNTIVIAVSIIGGIGTFGTSVYYAVRAYCNKTGPAIQPGKYMTNYSGHFEMDMLPAFVNLITSVQYLGETMETIETRLGFFNTYRYGSYLLTCPLMVYELIHTIGAPYAITMLTLTFFTLVTALFADLSPTVNMRWIWFAFGCVLNIWFFIMLLKVVSHAQRLNRGLCSDTQMNAAIKNLGISIDQFPKGLLKVQTPMSNKEQYINYAFGLMFILWPIFPLMFCLEYSGLTDRNITQIVFAITDLVIKTNHSYYVDQYKQGLRNIIVAYGFLDTSILYELNIWDEKHDVYSQLKGLSRSMYGDLLVSKTGNIVNHSNAGLDYHNMLVANRTNHNVDEYSEYEPKSSDSGSTESFARSSTPTRSPRSLSSRFLLTDQQKVTPIIEPESESFRSRRPSLSTRSPALSSRFIEQQRI